MAAMIKKKKYWSNGFTLIELLVVISIIAFLIGILVPILSRVRKQARHVICQSNLRQWGFVFYDYRADSDGRFPRATGGLREMLTEEPYTNWSDHHPHPPWYNVLRPYYKNNPGILLCPIARKPTSGEPVVAYGDTFRAWRSGSGRLWSYAVNRRILDVPKTHEWSKSIDLDSGIPVFSDSMYRVVLAYDDCHPPNQDGIAGWTSTGIMPVCFNRHNAGINVLFSDWSARKIGLKELWTLKWGKGFDTAGPWTLTGGVQPEDWPKWMRGFKDY